MPKDLKRVARSSYPQSLVKDFERASPVMKLFLSLYLIQMFLGLAAGFAAPWIGWK